MAVRTTMATLITRLRVLINDPASATQVFSDQTIQDVMDESRTDIVNQSLIPKPTFTGSTVQYLNYYAELGGWESDWVTKQYLVNVVSPSIAEEIAGHWAFSTTTLPSVYITGKVFDVYRAAADLLERQAAQWSLNFSFSSDGQSFQRAQVAPALLNLAKSYRMKQRPKTMGLYRSDLAGDREDLGLGPTAIDYIGSGQ